MGILSSIFSAPKTIDRATKLVDDSVRGIGTWIDQLNLTEEEKRELFLKLGHDQIDFVLKTQAESGARSLSRRYLMWFIAGIWSVFCLAGLAGWALGIELDGLLRLADALWIGAGFLSVVAFYFGPYFIGRDFQRRQK